MPKVGGSVSQGFHDTTRLVTEISSHWRFWLVSALALYLSSASGGSLRLTCADVLGIAPGVLPGDGRCWMAPSGVVLGG